MLIVVNCFLRHPPSSFVSLASASFHRSALLAEMDTRSQRVIALLDMDCFYVQVEQRDQSETWMQPAAVVQYNPWRGGGIIAVNYEARAAGVTRSMRGDDAKEKCPDMIVFQVAESRGKANLTKYRKASSEVFEVICNYSKLIVVERASIDEAYLDLTKLVATIPHIPAFEDVRTTHLGGNGSCSDANEDADENAAHVRDNCCFPHFYQSCSSDAEQANKNLVIAAKIVAGIRREIFLQTGLQCSAGISHNKVLAKLCCALHKPNAQTVLPMTTVDTLFMKTPIHKIRNLGGKLGEEIKEKFKITYFGQLSKLSMSELCSQFDQKTATWLYELVRGFDPEPVVARQIAKSIGCAKNFPLNHKTALLTKSQVIFWLNQLMSELIDRLIEDRMTNKRIAKLLSVGVRLSEKESVLRSVPLHKYEAEVILQDVVRHILPKVLSYADNNESLKEPVIMLSLQASKFTDYNPQTQNATLENFFSKTENSSNVNGENCSNVNGTHGVIVNESISVQEERVIDIQRILAECSGGAVKRGFFYRKSRELGIDDSS